MSASRFLVLAALLVAVASCSSSTSPGGGGGGGCNGTNANPAVCDSYFSPVNITVTAGGSVTWTWKGSIAHSVTFTSGSLNGTSSPTQSSGTFTQPFATAGTYNFKCQVHPTIMMGTVTVNP